MSDFPSFASIPRLFRDCTITEKIDGTNALVAVTDSGIVLAGSRSRWLATTADNFGFAAWVLAHEDELRELGPGRHYGEWWGPGIQRGYGLQERRFSLFNTLRWREARPACCDIVPVLFEGRFTTTEVEIALAELRENGSLASPGFMRPEGVVVYHHAARQYFKQTLERDEEPKSLGRAA